MIELSITPDALQAAGPRLERVIRAHADNILPPWCRKILVFFEHEMDTDDSGPAVRTTAAYIRCHPEYRLAKLTVGPPLLTYEDPLFEETVVHELVHALIWNVHQHYHDIRGFAPDGIADLLSDQWRRLNEEAVCDITRAYMAVVRLKVRPAP